MDINNQGTVRPAATNPNRPQSAAKVSPRAADDSTAPQPGAGQSITPVSIDDGGEQPGPDAPRGSLLDILV